MLCGKDLVCQQILLCIQLPVYTKGDLDEPISLSYCR